MITVFYLIFHLFLLQVILVICWDLEMEAGLLVSFFYFFVFYHFYLLDFIGVIPKKTNTHDFMNITISNWTRIFNGIFDVTITFFFNFLISQKAKFNSNLLLDSLLELSLNFLSSYSYSHVQRAGKVSKKK